MYIVIWEYQVKPGRVQEFEEIYSPNGVWAELFRKSKGFLGTELIREERDHRRFITIDRWTSAHEYEIFRLQWNAEYAALDDRCEGLTEKEVPLGKWETVLHKTR